MQTSDHFSVEITK